MAIIRRDFLRNLGAGLLGTAGILLPTAAQARVFGGRNRGRSCCPQESDAFSKVHTLGDVFANGNLTVSYPVHGGSSPTSPTVVFGNGGFATWGSESASYFQSIVLLDENGRQIPVPAPTDIHASLGTTWGYAFKGLAGGQIFQLSFLNGTSTQLVASNWFIMSTY